jgi:hypothetical protein
VEGTNDEEKGVWKVAKIFNRIEQGDKIMGVFGNKIIALKYLLKPNKAKVTAKDFAYDGGYLGSGYGAVLRERSTGAKMLYRIDYNNKCKLERLTVRGNYGEYTDINTGEKYYAGDYYDIPHGKSEGVVLAVKYEKGETKFTCIFKDKQCTMGLDEVCAAWDYFENVESEGNVFRIKTLAGVYQFNLDDYIFWLKQVRSVEENIEAADAKRAILGVGNCIIDKNGLLTYAEVGRNGVLNIPNNCKIIGDKALNFTGIKKLVMGGNIEKMSDYPLHHYKAGVQPLETLELRGVSAEIIKAYFLGGERCQIRYFPNIEAKGCLADVCYGVMCVFLDDYRISNTFTKSLYFQYGNHKVIYDYFRPKYTSSLCGEITESIAVDVLDRVIENIITTQKDCGKEFCEQLGKQTGDTSWHRALCEFNAILGLFFQAIRELLGGRRDYYANTIGRSAFMRNLHLLDRNY